jgi:hypothetical protein
VSYPTVTGDAVEGVPYREAQSCLGPTFAGATYKFFLTGTTTPANVYQDGALTNPFPITGFVTADSYGRFPPIYLDTSVIYKVQLYDSTNTLRWTVDPYTALLSTVGTSALSTHGVNIATTGEVTIPAPATGGTGISLTLKAGTLGITPLRIAGTLPGNSALIVNSSATTGAQTATFQSNTKPGTPPAAYGVALLANPAGATYTGGTLNVPFSGPTGTYVAQLSTGQVIPGAAVVNGATTFTVPSTVITGTPNNGVTLQVSVGPAGWLPITCDGVQYYTPIWHGNPFTPYAASPSALGEAIIANSVTFTGSGLTTVSGGSATPSNWYSPTSANIGANYDIQITKTSGLSGVVFSIGNTQTQITSGGLTVSTNAAAAISGTYNLLLHGTSTVVASGTITLGGNPGVESITYNSATPFIFEGDGTTRFNGVNNGINWYGPTTGGIGAGYYLLITQTGGTSGYTFSAATGTPANITATGISVGISGPVGASYNVTGTYIISSDSAGTVVLGSGTITLTGGSDVQSTNYSGATPLVLSGNGSATVGGSAAGSWYSPNVANVGSGYYINITRTSGTAGVNFSAAQGSWTNITNSSLTIGMSGYTGDVGTVTVGGTYQISSSNTGSPVLGSGTISLSVSAGTVIHVYTTAVTNATETIPTGTTNVKAEVWGGGGGGGPGYYFFRTGGSTNAYGTGGGSGGKAYSAYTAAALGGAGKTFTYTVPAGGTGGTGGTGTGSGTVGTGGGNGTISAGTVTGFTTMTGGGGGAGQIVGGSGGTAGTASGGNTTNTAGNAGQTSTGSPAGGGGVGVAGSISGDGSPYGAGGQAGYSSGYGASGGAGAAVFYYT